MSEETLVPAAYTIPDTDKARIERMAREQDLNASQVMRRILREYFAQLDAHSKSKSTKTVAA